MPLTAAGFYDPLPRVLTADDFDDGMNGWLDLRPNFVAPDFREHSDDIDLIHWGPTMLSSATFAFGGTHGSANGTYSLKISSRAAAAPADQPPAPGSMGLAIKRLSVPPRVRRLRIETLFAYKVEQDRPGLGVNDLRAFGMFVDLQDSEHRYMPGVRYVNAVGGEPVRRWQFYSPTDADDREWSYGADGWHKAGIDPQWFGARRADGSTAATTWFPDGGQRLIYNESDDKLNWTPLSLTVDLATRRYEEFRVGSRILRFPDGAHPTLAPAYDDIEGLLNPVFFVEADTDRRVSLFLDSVVISAAGGQRS
ncbi:DUF6772 family protein [Pseudonocardia sp. HH130630-07]|uniref:DUF6772 family protein n=1 Tax=Pseudonocardia sp. HH130630-07 TaxID=1690815 RepID=UPI000814D35F|nr:DUF6772 family protein [Pseudonocardia sp. HH130630-07]ANY06003.1 hypothetical protein AFB00_06455 [Pseudonocardia sp. HH130630-07]